MRLLLFVLAWMALLGCPPADAQTPVVFGQTALAGINQAAETDTYTVSATAGDTLLFRVGRRSGDLWPSIVLKDPYGTTVIEKFGTRLVEILQVANATGTYTVQVSDGYNGTLMGDYALFAQRTRDPGSALPAEVGGFLTGFVPTAATMNAVSLPLQAGDTVLLRATRTLGDVWPEVRLYDPSGHFVASKSEPITAEVETTVAAAGTYTVLVGDGFNGTLTGEYNLFAQVLNRPERAQPLGIGQTNSGTISDNAMLNTYTITAQAGDVLFLRLSRSGGLLWPMARLYGPTGQRLEEMKDSASLDLTRTLSAAGTYTLLVGDGFDGTKTGFYGLYAQRLNRPSNTIPLGWGQSHQGVVSKAGAMAGYTVHLDPALTPQVALRVRRTSGTFWPLIRLYDAAGVLLAESEDTSGPVLRKDISAAGDYLVLVGDGFNGTATGQYTLEWVVSVSDVVRALRAAGGFDAVTPETQARWNLATGDTPERIDLRDVSAIARGLSGL